MNVKALQTDLKTLGFYTGSIDGSFGPMSKAAVKTFQQYHGLKVDGSPGRNTQRKLLEVLHGITELWLNSQTKLIKIPRKMEFNVAKCKEPSEYPHMVQKSLSAPILMNGGLFGISNGVTLSYLVDDGVKETSGVYSKYALARFTDGSQQIRGMTYWEKYGMDKVVDAIGASPTLIVDGKVRIDSTGLDYGFMNYRHPRIALGYDDEHFYVIIVHGRQKWRVYIGATIAELAKIADGLDLEGCINLDGGGSIQVLNRYGARLDNNGGIRKVDNVVYFE